MLEVIFVLADESQGKDRYNYRGPEQEIANFEAADLKSLKNMITFKKTRHIKAIIGEKQPIRVRESSITVSN